MKNQTLKLARTILLVLVVILIGLTAYLYFKTGKFNFPPVVTALGCLVIFLITGQMRDSGKQ
jgi:CHASE2 domain-containing sensor protein